MTIVIAETSWIENRLPGSVAQDTLIQNLWTNIILCHRFYHLSSTTLHVQLHGFCNLLLYNMHKNKCD